jgi:hypothetical protein
MDAVQLRSLHRQMVLTDLKLGKILIGIIQDRFCIFVNKGIIDVDPETGLRYYIDPISMIIANIQESSNSTIVPLYYKVYNKIIPKIYDICKILDSTLRRSCLCSNNSIGKRYCPYLVRWHWTFLLIIGMIEQIFIYFIYRVYYFQTFVLIPQVKSYGDYVNSNLVLQINVLNGVIACVVLAHIGFIIFGLFHAIWGQYFYIPFFVENTELHIGPRPKNSIYSGGQTAWQDPEEKKKFKPIIPKLWYGWIGKGTKNNWQLGNNFRNLLKRISKKENN